MATLEEVIAAMEATAGGKVKPCAPIEDWPQLYVRKMLVEEIDFDSDTDDDPEKKQDGKRLAAIAAIRVLCFEDGRRMFDPKNEKHIALLKRQTWDDLQAILESVKSNSGNLDGAGNSSTN